MIRFAYLIATCIAGLAAGASVVVERSPTLIWNVSASVPIGLFAVHAASNLEVADLVAAVAPEPLATFLADGGYLPRNVPLLKRLVALPGQVVCRFGVAITVDDIEMGDALSHDRLGRDLPVWEGCRLIGDGEIFLMNWQSNDSLDGRYFGPLPSTSIIGRAVPVWTDEEGSGRFEWFAPTR